MTISARGFTTAATPRLSKIPSCNSVSIELVCAREQKNAAQIDPRGVLSASIRLSLEPGAGGHVGADQAAFGFAGGVAAAARTGLGRGTANHTGQPGLKHHLPGLQCAIGPQQ